MMLTKKEAKRVLDRHFDLSLRLDSAFREKRFDEMVRLCREQIALSVKAAEAFREEDREIGCADAPLPSHMGFRRLCVFLEKQGEYQEVIALCERAMREGWAGDETRRIERCEKKLATANETQNEAHESGG
ncbi:MAG: hypothetical protein M5R36_29555 [Deltaproteobacteria bacterium]|nr:hypothetical protein [Deltaproteobacteria bacterium]